MKAYVFDAESFDIRLEAKRLREQSSNRVRLGDLLAEAGFTIGEVEHAHVRVRYEGGFFRKRVVVAVTDTHGTKTFVLRGGDCVAVRVWGQGVTGVQL